jgi:hypothetical protein
MQHKPIQPPRIHLVATPEDRAHLRRLRVKSLVIGGLFALAASMIVAPHVWAVALVSIQQLF